MADTINSTGSPAPVPAPAPGRRAGKDERVLSIAREQQEARVKYRHRKNNPQSVPQLDGTMSDSVTNPAPSPRSKKPPPPKPQRQSVANGATPQPNGNMGKAYGQKPRPVSLGGPLLPATPAKEQAYAGPTFHNSPAPASLPMPRFFSKSVPNGANPLQARLDGEKTPEKQESSPEPDIVQPATVPREAVQSPLDLLFKADRADKEKSRSSSMLSPEMAARRPPATEPRNPFQKSGKSIFLAEMDRESDEMPSPRTLPPNSRPAPAERARSSPNVIPGTGGNDEQRDAMTKSLKDLLFNSMNDVPAQTQNPSPPPTQLTQQRAQSDAQIFNTPSPYNQRSASGPSTPAPSSADQANHYALHYGNRANLSPLFKAARTETPTRPSSLRQELPNCDPAPIRQAASPPQPRHMPHIDPNTFSRTYLDEQIRANKPASLPQLPFMNGVASPSGPGQHTSASVSGPSAVSQHGAQGGVNSGAGIPNGPASPRTGGPGGPSRDIRSMEDDLRRMLKLNVSG